jgi:hypothetical protein
MLDLKIEIQALGRYDLAGRGLVFEDDSWFHWQPDPERAFREHDPARVPFAWMSRHDILAHMRTAKGGREWEFYQEFLIDKCTDEERQYDRFLAILLEHGGLGRDELCYAHGCGGVPTRVVRHAESPATVPHAAADG